MNSKSIIIYAIGLACIIGGFIGWQGGFIAGLICVVVGAIESM